MKRLKVKHNNSSHKTRWFFLSNVIHPTTSKNNITSNDLSNKSKVHTTNLSSTGTRVAKFLFGRHSAIAARTVVLLIANNNYKLKKGQKKGDATHSLTNPNQLGLRAPNLYNQILSTNLYNNLMIVVNKCNKVHYLK